MATADELNESFGIPGVLAFDEPHAGLVRARISSRSCTAEVFLHGAHLSAWQPAGTEPVIYLSPRSLFEAGKPIRGGVPIVFPWFGPRTPEVSGARTDGPSHGYARTTDWQVSFAAQMGDDVHMVLSLPPTDEARQAGFDGVRLSFELRLGPTLTMRLAVANERDEPVVIEEALHTYLHVSDAAQIRLRGLHGAEYLDKTDNFARKTQDAPVITLTRETDRPYLNTTTSVTVDDPGFQRRLVVAKAGSQTTVVWNPNEELSAKLPDLGAGEWHHFVCVETANAADNRLRLAGREAHVMEARISVEELPANA